MLFLFGGSLLDTSLTYPDRTKKGDVIVQSSFECHSTVAVATGLKGAVNAFLGQLLASNSADGTFFHEKTMA